MILSNSSQVFFPLNLSLVPRKTAFFSNIWAVKMSRQEKECTSALIIPRYESAYLSKINYSNMSRMNSS